jgi:CheY-like chemotaxis protein
LTTINNKNKIKTLDSNFFKTLYSPINFSKISKALLDFNRVDHNENIGNRRDKFTNIKALVAEDNLINQKLIKLTLENIGLSVTLANNGKEAFELRRSDEIFDVIFMDIQMPIMTGTEATHAIITYEKEQKLAHIPIIALTANALKGDKEHFLKQGMDQYISKPIKLDEIRNILDLYFKDKHISENTVSTAEEKPENELVDILLCKKEKGDLLIFDTLLKGKGYSVEIAKNIKDLKKMIQSKKYTHVLLDRNLEGLSEDSELSQMMKFLSIKSILFIEDKNMVREEDYEDYTRVALNIANSKFLDHIIKLNLK